MPTALVTGASSGIGWEIAKELARHRFDLVLVARREERLRELEALLAPHVRVQVIPADLSDHAAPQRLFEEVQSLPIDLLVNNAGFGSYGRFATSELDNVLAMVQLNVVALTHLTRLFLPPMLERGQGRILNVASTAAFFSGPGMALYFATKAFVLSLSEAIDSEVQGTGVTVTCSCPGATTTEFQARAAMLETKLAQDKLMDARTVARRSVAATLRGQRVVIPGVNNQLVNLLSRILPRHTNTELVGRLQEMGQRA